MVSATRTICLASSSALLALLLAAVAGPATLPAQQTLALAHGRTLTCPAHAQRCLLHANGHTRSVLLPRDAATLLQDTATLKLVAALPSAIIFTDSYSSQPGGAGLCQAGTESFLRVLSLSQARPTLTYSTKLESCVQNLELSLDGIAWDASTHRLTLHWLSAPGSHKPLDTSLTLNDAGHLR